MGSSRKNCRVPGTLIDILAEIELIVVAERTAPQRAFCAVWSNWWSDSGLGFSLTLAGFSSDKLILFY